MPKPRRGSAAAHQSESAAMTPRMIQPRSCSSRKVSPPWNASAEEKWRKPGTAAVAQIPAAMAHVAPRPTSARVQPSVRSTSAAAKEQTAVIMRP
eukprot:1261211-Prymnesium_polylepis.2